MRASHLVEPYEKGTPRTAIDVDRVQSFNDEPSMTKQALAEDLDVNNIIKRHDSTGVLAKATAFEGIYGDFDELDLREAIEKVNKANELFLQVPSNVRGIFENDAGAFIDYATDPANVKQMREWGLANPEPPPVPDPAPAPAPDPDPAP